MDPINKGDIAAQEPDKEGMNRRSLLKLMAATGGVVTLSNLPSKWSKPGFEVGYLAAHAQMSPVLGTGDFQTTLTWNTGNPEVSPSDPAAVDIDLHVIEPDGTHVYYGQRQGTTATLDIDNRSGLGPENIFVGANAAANGTYDIYVVYYAGSAFPTRATVTVRVFANTAQERSMTFTRDLTTEDPSLRVNVARVTYPGGTIEEVGGTQALETSSRQVAK